MNKVLSTGEYLDRLRKLKEAGDIEGIKRFLQEYSDCKIDYCSKAIRTPLKVEEKGILDDEPF